MIKTSTGDDYLVFDIIRVGGSGHSRERREDEGTVADTAPHHYWTG